MVSAPKLGETLRVGKAMKKGFTLIEMMIVVAILVVLMTITFRLSKLGSNADRRTRTVTRMQKLENCLSGYHAAFGSYPPVKLHGSRDIYNQVDRHGIQNDERNENLWNWNKIGEQAEWNAWNQVNAACKSQPVDCRFPYPEGYSKKIDIISEEMQRRANSGNKRYAKYFSDEATRQKLAAGFDDGFSRNPNRHSKNKDAIDWRNVQLFKFGLMSFLLPRYLVMMNGDDVFFSEYKQWTGNNVIPCDPFTGNNYSTWQQVKQYSGGSSQADLAHVANVPSQAVCARWMPNLETTCAANHEYSLFGINIRDSWDGTELSVENTGIEVFSPAGEDSTSNQYILDGISVRDGWGRDFYYYSPAPYQRYTLWSGGENGRTFPPWISRKGLSSKANQCISLWIWDDIIHMTH